MKFPRALTVGIFVLLGATVLGLVFPAKTTFAADARNFNAGRIIDDSIFTDSNTMSVQDIQEFLNSKVKCDTWGQKPSELGGGTRAQWMGARGIYGPYRCITDYYENPSNSLSNYGRTVIPDGAISAAQIIYNYSRQFDINPQVLIVTLQKENGLITDEWPTPKQFSEAMGFGCPDNVAPGAPACDPSFNSFSAQIYQAARHFRGYIDNPSGWWVPYNTGDNTVYFNPGPYDSANNRYFGRFGTRSDIQYCGSTTVNIENRSTVALYSYTPYQPNQSSKNAQYGKGDGCGAYGNRNFYLYFNDWFGPTIDAQPIIRSSTSGRMFIRAASGALYYISNADQLSDIGYGYGMMNTHLSVNDTYVNSHGYSDMPALIQFEGAPEVYTYTSGVLHYVNYSTYQAYGSPAIGVLPAYIKRAFTTGGDASVLVNNNKNGELYMVSGGKRRYVVGPEAYSHYNLSTYPTSTGGPTILAAIPEAAPLAKPGTVFTSPDQAVGAVVSEDGAHQYPLNKELNKSLQINKFVTSADLIAKLDPVSSQVKNLAKDSSNNLYLIDQQYKLLLTPAQFASLGYDAASYTLAPQLLLSRLETRSQASDKLLIKIGGDPNTYLIQNKELLLFEWQSDVVAYGYKANDALTITRNTYDTYFNYKGAALLPNGILIRASDSTYVYLLTADGGKTHITTAYKFANLGYSFDWVRVVSPQSVARIPTREDVLPYAVDRSGQTWILYQGAKRLVPPAYVSNYGLLTTTQANQITPWQLESLPRTYNASKFVRIDNTANIYVVDAGATHLLSAARYLSLGGTWSDVTPISSDLFYKINQGEPWL